MNEQKPPGHIEWTRIKNKDGSIRKGYTWNPISGCLHACQWVMPDGTVANCYAEDVAERSQAKEFYPQGFSHHYFNEKRLAEPARVKQGGGIFWGSMTDNFGHWIPEDQLNLCLKAISDAPQHTFIALTKNPKRMANVALGEVPDNIWWGASSPPDKMWNKDLNRNQQEAMLDTTLFQLNRIHKAGHITWMSAEPLSWDIAPIVREFYETGNQPLDWIVIGAASNGSHYYPPAEAHVKSLVATCDHYGIKVFYKGNLHSLPWAAQHWREEFPNDTSV